MPTLAAAAQILADNVANLSPKSRDFASSLLTQYNGPRGLSHKQAEWLHKLAEQATAPVPKKAAVGEVRPILDLFARIRQHLKAPAIVLHIETVGLIRISPTGERSQYPGALNVKTYEHNDQGEREWLGRIEAAGDFTQSRKATVSTAALLYGLRAFAADPVTVAREHGRKTGRCCLCNRALKDERSTAVGYGPICADRVGWPWGEVS